MLIDTHAHISYFPKDEQKSVINRAFQSGVIAINNISTEVSKFSEVLESCYNFANIFCTVGTHPCHVQDEPNITSQVLVDLIKKHKKIIGIGETGLDYYHSMEHKALQIKQFKEHILAGVITTKPIIVHTRNADDDTLAILKEAKNQYGESLKILIHCFTGGIEFCKKLLGIGCYISFSGIITFKNAKEIKEAMLSVPIERLLIETDSPYLAPEPHRGKKNEPAFVKYVAESIAKERNIPYKDICSITGENFCKLFCLKL